jgi:hypothetical protein
MNKTSLVLRPEQIPAFLAAVKHNKAVLIEQLRTRRICDADYYFVKTTDNGLELIQPETHTMDNGRAFNDFVAGSLVGALPFADLHGSDGIRLDECGNIREVELKLCMKSNFRYEIHEKGHINIINGSGNFRSDVCAYYEIVHNINKKNVDTYLIAFDKDTWELIDVYRMTGEKVVELLAKNQTSGEDKTSKKRSITLAAFMKHGQKVYQETLEPVGVEAWEKRIYDRYGRDPSDAHVWSKDRDELFISLWTTGEPLDKILALFPGRTKKAIQSRAKFLKVKRPVKS